VSQWGHDFRPDYTNLSKFFERFSSPKVPVMALTGRFDSPLPHFVNSIRPALSLILATATPKILQDARSEFGR